MSDKLKKPKVRLNSREILEVLNKQWLNTQDVMNVGFVGNTVALRIKKEITDSLSKQGYKLPRGLVPSDKVTEYFKINLNYLRKASRE